MAGTREFIKISSIDPVVDYLSDTISTVLAQDKKVLWLVPGGSSIKIAAEVSKRLAGSSLKNLYVSLTDERYGDVGHADSNWLQLEQAGFNLPEANLRPVLIGQDFDKTIEEYGKEIDKDMQAVDFRIGFFGIGPDGHTAGVLPGSPAVSDKGLTSGYDAGVFKRVTITASAIDRLDEAVVYAVGQDKWPVIDQLDTDIPVNQQPAQMLKAVPRLMIFNDHKSSQL